MIARILSPVFSRVFCRIGIELLLAARSTEIILFSLELARKFCSLLIYGHLADWIDRHFRTSFISLSLLLVYTF